MSHSVFSGSVVCPKDVERLSCCHIIEDPNFKKIKKTYWIFSRLETLSQGGVPLSLSPSSVFLLSHCRLYVGILRVLGPGSKLLLCVSSLFSTLSLPLSFFLSFTSRSEHVPLQPEQESKAIEPHILTLMHLLRILLKRHFALPTRVSQRERERKR